MRLMLALLFATFTVSASCFAEEKSIDAAEVSDNSNQGHGILESILLYLPNRLFDLVDIVRLRARVGPGFAMGVRATKIVQANLGGYSTVFVGLPGPRQDPSFPLPLGLEMYAGAALSVAEVGTNTWGPDYSPTEFGVHTQLALVGFDIGIDPYEIVDLALGLVFLDPVGDDL